MTSVKTRVLRGFDDPAFGPERWEELLRAGDTDVVFLTWHWQRSWWETLGRGELLLIAGERNGQVVALAPFYADSGMIFFVGSGKARNGTFRRTREGAERAANAAHSRRAFAEGSRTNRILVSCVKPSSSDPFS